MTNILIVDDYKLNRYMLAAMLKGNGYRVTTAVNGVMALEAAAADPPDLIISDILMPDMDGFALCRHWQKDPKLKNIPFIFYTATYTDPKDEEFALSLGADRFIVKPQEPEVLLRLIEEVRECPPSPQREPQPDETVYFKEYNEALIRKLESKLAELQETNRALENEIAERERVEEKLRFTQYTVAHAVVLIAWADFSTGRFVYMNETLQNKLGYSREELGDLYLSEVDMSFSPWPEFMQKLREKGVLIFESSHTTKSGSNYPVEVTAEYTRFDGNEYVIAFIRDVTRRKRAEEALRESEEQLRHAQKMEAVGRLAGGVAHDFNNLLTTISGYTELLMLKLDENDALRTDAEQVMRAAGRAAVLTRQLLAFSRKQILQPRVLALNDVIANTEKMLGRLIGEDIRIITDLSPELLPVKADQGQIEQVIMNLAINARDAMPQGGKFTLATANVTLDEESARDIPGAIPGRFVRLMISDTGIGMDRVTIAHIFEPFFTTKGPEEGTGLGLSIVYGIVRQHGGWIDTRSKPGRGTTFNIYLPAFLEASDDRPGENTTLKTIKGDGEGILLVEDDEMVRTFAARVLREYGYNVFESSTASAAENLFRKEDQAIDLLFSDIILPDGTGSDLAAELQTIRPNLKVLLSSGYLGPGITDIQRISTDFPILKKPYAFRELLQFIHDALINSDEEE
jgi:PAS domain S-box-containing protein